MGNEPHIQAFFDEATSTVSYIVSDPSTRKAVVIDPVLDYDHRSGKAATRGADALLAAVSEGRLTVEWVLETHAHADHLSAAPYIKLRTGAKVAIGEHICDVQNIFRPVFNLDDVSGDGREFDRLLKDGEVLHVGSMSIEVIHTPGHTPACVSYKIGDAVFVGDTLFMPDYGTARADFPGGDARTLYRSIRRLLSMPDETRLFLCHDYLTETRKQHVWETTVGDQRRHNVHVNDSVAEDDFVRMREARDARLAAPTLLLPSIQVNVRAGRFPAAEDNGVRYLKIPLQLPAGLEAAMTRPA